jgi:hypothetical protein
VLTRHCLTGKGTGPAVPLFVSKGLSMNLEPQVAIAIAVPVVSVVVWLVRLEGRINLSDARHADIKEVLNEIKGDVRKIRSFMGGGVER